jgi:hypothetical protein
MQMTTVSKDHLFPLERVAKSRNMENRRKKGSNEEGPKWLSEKYMFALAEAESGEPQKALGEERDDDPRTDHYQHIPCHMRCKP